MSLAPPPMLPRDRDRPVMLSEARSLYEAMGHLRLRLDAIDGKIDTLLTLVSHRPRSPSLAEAAGQALADATGPHASLSSTPPLLAWAQRGIGKVVIAVAKHVAMLAVGAGLVHIWVLLHGGYR